MLTKICWNQKKSTEQYATKSGSCCIAVLLIVDVHWGPFEIFQIFKGRYRPTRANWVVVTALGWNPWNLVFSPFRSSRLIRCRFDEPRVLTIKLLRKIPVGNQIEKCAVDDRDDHHSGEAEIQLRTFNLNGYKSNKIKIKFNYFDNKLINYM